MIRYRMEFLAKNKAHNITIFAAFVVSVISYVILSGTHNPKTDTELKLDQPQSSVSDKQMEGKPVQVAVDVGGAVNKPGVYYLPIDSRLTDALKRAGGVSTSADKKRVSREMNLSTILTDQQKIYIPSVGEEYDAVFSNSSNARPDSPQQPTDSSKMNINTATAGELDSLDGVGPATAAKIVAGRPFTTVQDLLDLKILSKSVFEGIQDRLTI